MISIRYFDKDLITLMFITQNFYVRFAFVGDMSRDNFVWSMLAGLKQPVVRFCWSPVDSPVVPKSNTVIASWFQSAPF